MVKVNVDLNRDMGRIKAMHGVNNGPVHRVGKDQDSTNLRLYQEAGIPYARNHDASFCSIYGGAHTVDIQAVFPDFERDPYDEMSYDFDLTDDYLSTISLAGAKCFYRLGSKIEHARKKYGTLPPKDFQKWAVICEHIIRHYTEGWANGFHMDIEYWEIWNEPDLDPDDATDKRTWGGTKEQYFALYRVAATHLKQCFPHLKIGGPALAHNLIWLEDFLKQLDAPLDFCSWHIYAKTPQKIEKRMYAVRELLDQYGYTKTESILNEWNYVKGWSGDDFVETIKTIKGMKGAAFTAATFALGQKAPLDLLMYYDARPCAFNGMFDTDFSFVPLKGYYPFRMFNRLYQLKNSIFCDTDDEQIYAVAAKDGKNTAVMITYFSDVDSSVSKDVEILFHGFAQSVTRCELLDDTHDCAEISQTVCKATNSIRITDMKPQTVYLICTTGETEK